MDSREACHLAESQYCQVSGRVPRAEGVAGVWAGGVYDRNREKDVFFSNLAAFFNTCKIYSVYREHFYC